MTTPDSKFVKNTLKANGVNVKRSLVYAGRLIVTVSAENADLAASLLKEMGLVQQFSPINPPRELKVNILGYANAAEFTNLVQK